MVCENWFVVSEIKRFFSLINDNPERAVALFLEPKYVPD